MADEEGRLSFVAGMDDSDFVRGANNIRNEINKTANEVRKTGMTVDEFVSHMQVLVSSFDKLTQSVDRNTKAQEEVAEAGKKAAAEEKEGADKATRAIRETTKATNELGGAFDGVKSKVAGALTLASLMAFEKKVIEVRSEMESLQKSFESLAGEHVGRQLYEDIKQFATTTPMMMKDLAKGAQTLLGFNMEAEKIMPILRQIGDISMGDAQKFNSLTLAFAQMSSTGKLMGQDLLQMINAGFNPLVTISEKTGKSIGELKDEMAKGAITVEMVEDAFRTATAEGGKFHNMLETQSKTMKGALSNLQGAYEDMLNEIGEKQQGVMLKGIEITQKLVQNYETVGKVLLTIIATYGTYRAAVMAATVAENLLNGTYTVKIRLLRAAAAAQTLLNKTMLANPYVLAATALAAVVSSLIAFRSRTDEASEAQKRINSTFEETQGKIAAEQKQIDSLFDKLRKAEKGTDEYKKAKDAILNQYGDYLKGLGREIETLENVEKAYREVAKAAREAALARGREAALGEANENYGKGYASNMGKLQNALTSTAGKKDATEALRQIQKELRDTGTISTETEKKVRNLLRGSADYGNAEAWFTSLRKNEKELQNAIERADTLFKQESKDASDSTAKAKSLGQAYSDAQQNFEKAFNKIEDMKKSRAEYTEQQWKEAQEALKNAKKTFEELGGDPDGKQAKKTAAAASKAAKEDAAERQKEYDLDLKQREEQAKKVQAAENALAAAEIAATRNAAERERKERENQHRLALQQIDDEEEEMKKRQVEAMRARWEAQKENKDKAWADTATAKDIAKNGYANIILPEEDIKLLEARRKQVNEESKRDQHDTAEALIREYQSYTDKKEAIDEKYREATESINAEIVKAQERGDQQAVDALRRSLAEAAKERAKGQAQLSLEQLKETPEYVRAFEDLEQTSTRTLEMLIGMFEEAKKAAAQSMNPEDLREYTQTLQQLYDEVGRRDPFRAMASSSKELEEAQERTRVAASRLTAVQQKQQIPVSFEIDKATGKLVVEYLTLEKAEKDLAEAEDDEAKKRQKHKKAVKEAGDKIEELASSIRGLGDAMGGIGGEILNIIGDVMSVTMGVMNAVEITSKTAAESISTVEKASVILAVISAALQVVMKIAEVAKGLLGFDDGEQFEKAKQSYEALSDVWDELIEKKREYLDESWGKEAKAATQEIIRLLEAEQKQAEILARQRLDVTNGSHSMWYRMWQGSYKSSVDDNKGALNAGAVAMFGKINWRDVNHAIEQGLKSAGLGDVTFNAMEDMLTFTSEQLDWIKTNYTGLWTAMDDDFRELLEKHASLTGDMEEAIKAMQERMTGTTAENVIEDFMEALYGLADGSADVMEEVADNWQQMVNRMAVNTLVTQELKERLTKWYENLAKIEEDYTSGIIDETTYRNRLNAAQTEYNSTLDETRQRMATLQELGVIKPIEETAKEISEVFDSIRDAWASAVTGMKEDSESLGKEIARIMFEQLVKSNVLNKDFDDWLKDWVSRYEEALNVKAPGEREGRLRQLEEERTAKVNALTEATKAYAEAAGYAAEEDSEFTNSLDNLGDTLLNALLDTETDAAEMGRQMGMTLIKEMLSEMLAADKYKTQTEAIRQLWQNVLKSENGTFIDAEGVFGVKDAAYTYSDVLKRIADLNNQIAEDDAITTLADQYKLLGENTDKAKSSFEGLRSTLKNSLTDINATTEDFRKQLEKTVVGDLIDRMVLDVPITIGEVDYKSFDEFTEKWNERYLKALAEGNEEAIALLMEELVEARNITAKAAEEYTQRLKEAQKDTTFTDMEGNFVSALMDMEGDINDFANDMKKVIVQRLVESFMVSEKIKPILDDLQETLNYALSNDDKNWTPEQRAEFIENGDANHSGINDYLKDFEGLQDVVKAIMKAIGYKAKETSEEVAGVFDNLGSSIVDSLMEAEGGVDDFMKTLTDTIVRELADSYMATEDMQKKLAEVKKGLEDAVKSGNPARIKEAQQAVRDFYADAEKGAKAYKDALVQVQQEQDTTFKDMSGDFVSALMDMGTTAEDWASQIGRTMAQRIIEQMVVTSQVQPLLDSLQEVFNTAMSAPGATWQSVMGSAEIQQQLLTIKNAFPGMQEMVKSVMEALGVSFGEVTEDAKEGFGDLRSAFVSTLTSMEGDAEAFGKSIGDTMRQQMIDKLVDKKYGQTLEQMNDAWAEALDAGDTKKMKEIIDYLEYIYGRIADDKEIKQLTEDLKKVQEQADTTFKDMKDEFVSSLMTLDATADDFGQQIGETLVRRIVEKMMVAKYLQPMLDNLQNAVDKAMNAEGATPASVMADAGVLEMLDRIRVAYPELANTVREMLEKVGIKVKKEGFDGLSGLGDTLLSSLMDGTDAGEFGRNIAQTLIREMIEQLMDEKYAQRIADIREHWQEVLKGEQGVRDENGNLKYSMESVRKEITDLNAEMNAEGSELSSLASQYNALNKETEETKEGFSDLAATIADALKDSAATAEKFAENLRRTMQEDMLKAYINHKWADNIKSLNDAWADALKAGDTDKLTQIQKDVEALYKRIGDDEPVTKLATDLRKVEEALDDTFSGMADSWTQMLTNIDSGAEDWGREIGRTLVSKIVKELVVTQELQKYLDAIQTAYTEAIGKEGTTMESVLEAVKPKIDDAVKATEHWKPIVDAVNKAFQDVEDTVTETPFDNIRQSFLSSLMDMKADTKDFGDDITKILTEAFINSFVLDKEFDNAVKQWQKRYSEIMGDKTLDNAGRAKQLNDLKRAISDTRTSLAEEAKAIHELMGTNNMEDQSAYMNTAQSITYDQADLIGGMMTSLVMGQGEGNEVRKQILATLQAMQNVTTPRTDYGQQIFQRLGYTNDYLRDIRKTSEAILSSFTDKLNAVIERLS